MVNKSFFDRLTVTVPIDSENSITVTAPTYGQSQEANSKAMLVQVDMNGQGNVTFDTNKLEQLLMRVCIVAWSGPGFEDRKVTPENIDALPTYVLAKIRPAINELTKGMTDEEKKD